MNASLFENKLNWRGERKGIISTCGLPAVEVGASSLFPNGYHGMWTPEQLLLAAVNSGLMMSFLSISEMSGLAITGYDSKATGVIENVEGQLCITEVVMEVKVEVPEGIEWSEVIHVMDKAERSCLIKSTLKAATIVQILVKYAQPEETM